MRFLRSVNIILSVVILITACTPKPLDIKVKPAQPKLVISSRVIPNKIILVSVTRSFSALENKENTDSLSQNFMDKILVKNAFVTVSYFGKTDTLFKISDGLYGSLNTLLVTSGTYNLYAKDNDTGLEVSSGATMLPYYQFDSIQPKKIINPGDTVCKVYYELSDDPSSENYYVVNYVRKLNSGNSGPIDINQFFANGSSSFETYFDLLSDESFSNGKYKNDKILETVRPKDSIAVMVSNISRGYYEFLSAYKRAGNLFNTLTGEPINYPTNVNGGYGYFNAHYPQIKYFDMKNY